MSELEVVSTVRKELREVSQIPHNLPTMAQSCEHAQSYYPRYSAKAINHVA